MKSNIQRISRAAVCLVLVCCLIVNISPAKARAVDPATAVAFDFAVRSVIASAMQGLGVSKGSNPTVFDGIVNSAVDALGTSIIFISDGLARVARFNLGSGASMFFLPLAFLETIRDWLWGEGEVLTSSDAITLATSGSYLVGSDVYNWSASSDSFVVCFTKGTYSYIYAFGNGSFVQNGYSVSLSSGPTHGYWYKLLASTTSVVSGLPTYSVPSSYTFADNYFKAEWPFVFGEGVTSSYDVTLGDVGIADQTIEEAYPTWAENTVSVPGSVYGSDDDYVPSIPIAVAPDYEGTTNISQSDVQAGNSTWVDTETDTDVGTDTSPEALAGTVATTIAWDFISGLFDVFVPGFELISNAVDAIGTLLKALPQTLKDVFGIDAFLEKISAIYETVVQGFLDTITGIRSIPQAITDVLAAIFVPSTDYITAKVEAIRAKFPFMDSIIATGEYIRDSLSGSSGPPAIYVDLTLADGDIDYGEKTLLTDFSWYAPYKGTVDSVLGAALWAFFGWRVFLRLPGLISGADGYVGEIRTLSSRSSGAGGRKKED